MGEPSSSAGRYLATVAGSAPRHLLSPLVDSCCVIYQLHGTIDFPSLQGLQQSLAALSPPAPTFIASFSLCTRGCRLCCAGNHCGIHFVHANCIPSYNFCTNFCWNVNNITSQFSLILPTVIIPHMDNCTNCPF